MNISKASNQTKTVLVVYTCFPHYRSAVIEELNDSDKYNYIFVGSEIPHGKSINLMKFGSECPLYKTDLKFFNRFLMQPGLSEHVNSINHDVIIFLGNPYIVSYWYYAILERLKGKVVLFWTHGWIDSKESGLKRIVRNLFYRLANGLLLYGNRAAELGARYGFDKKNLNVIYNSLDYNSMRKIYNGITENNEEIKKSLSIPLGHEILICSARLTSLCRFDLLIDAVSLLINEGRNILVILIGDGPMRSDLVNQSIKQNVTLIDVGACYDESIISRYYKIADLAVSPGKVGLSAMHSLTYETPLITHNNFDRQMPEYEAIVPGVSGDFFEEGKVEDLAIVISKWLDMLKTNNRVGQDCLGVIEKFYTPRSQRKHIEESIEQYF